LKWGSGANHLPKIHIELPDSNTHLNNSQQMHRPKNLSSSFRLLSELVFDPSRAQVDFLRNRQDVENLTALATKNHVIIRAFRPLGLILESGGKADTACCVWEAIDQEEQRILHAVEFLKEICLGLEEGGCQATVMKSLDHWPDLGSDLDLYLDADPQAVIAIMKARFHAKVDARSWGDRLANKWNFVVPGLPELVEIHISRLGQTGEHTALSRSLKMRSRFERVGSNQFRVPAPEDRIVVSTLQRMYRHFYVRLCDIVDNARLLSSGGVDFGYLRSLGSESGIWQGIAAYLNIVSGYVESFRGVATPLPSSVIEAARFGAAQLTCRRNFLRVPIVPHSVNLYGLEFKRLLLKRELGNSLRLSLLPCLATAAVIEQKITGSDKGIW